MKNRLDYEAHLSRHSHDISAGYTASIAPGMIIPQYFHILGPGDSIYYNSHMFARLQDVVTAFLGEIDIHIDSFFVPLQMLYTPFGQVFAQTDDFISSNFGVNSFGSQDSFPIYDLKASIEDNAPSQTSGNGDECWGKQTFRLLDALDLNPLGVCSDNMKSQEQFGPDPTAIDDVITYNPNIAPWIPAAYQCIYQKYYRNDELERLGVDKYNFDYQFSNATPFDDANMLFVRYVQRPSDYFTSVRVSPIASAVNTFASQNTFPANGGNLPSLINAVDSFLTTSPFNVTQQLFGNVANTQSSAAAFNSVSNTSFNRQPSAANETYLSASNIRALFAVDKFSRIYGRADKTYDDQILAHFGIKIPHDVKHDLTHLKHFRAVLQADPVYATANVQTAQASTITTLGQVGGQGQVDFNSQQDKFTAPVHGVFMIVAYVVTKPRYVGTFSKLHLATNRLSFPIPEYDKLGAQPLYGFECDPIYFQIVNNFAPGIGVRVGWQNRYAQYKQKYNRSSWLYYSGQYGHGSVSANSYGPWVISKLPFSNSIDSFGGLPSITNVTVPATSAFVNAQWFFERADSLDCVMHRKFDAAWSDTYFKQPHLMLQSDPILTEFMCNAKLVSWMSETGEPDL